MLKCVLCGNDTIKSKTDLITKQGNKTVTVNNIPCKKCTVCNEAYFSDDVETELEQILNDIKKCNEQIIVVDFDTI